MATVRATSGSDADVDDGEATALAMRRRDRRRARASAGGVAITARRRARMKEAVVGDLAALARRRGTRGSARARATRECASDDEDEMDFRLSMQYVEIYNEKIKDLLNPSDANLDVREVPSRGTYVAGATDKTVSALVDDR